MILVHEREMCDSQEYSLTYVKDDNFLGDILFYAYIIVLKHVLFPNTNNIDRDKTLFVIIVKKVSNRKSITFVIFSKFTC